MSPRIQAIESLLEQRARRQFRVAVSFGAAIAILVAAVAYVLYSDYQQDRQIQTVSACADRPNSIECRRGHANSVSLTTHAESCFILAQGGIRCKDRPLPDAEVFRNRLLAESNAPENTTAFQYEAVPDQSSSTGRAPDLPTSDGPAVTAPGDTGQSVPRPPRTPRPAPPTSPTPSQPSPEPPAPVEPTPAAPRPVVDLPDQLGLCVNALGISVIC